MSLTPFAPARVRLIGGLIVGAALAVAGAVTTPHAQGSPQQPRGKPATTPVQGVPPQAPATVSPLGAVAGRNVNMVSGHTWPDGDPFLQRQNEPSVAASTRNPLHLMAGANDYRTVDLPGLPDGQVTGDAWVGLFKSFDGGQTWRSTLVPGYPQDASCNPARTPQPDPSKCGLFGYQAAADPVVRPGTNGLLYYTGLAFNRGDNAPSAVFVARFIDNNNNEGGDPIVHLGTAIVARDPGTTFIDKPWLAVDVPRGSATCAISTPGPNGTTIRETVPAGPLYVAFTEFSGSGSTLAARIMFASSLDCGAHWSAPIQLSPAADHVNQGASIAIDPQTGNVYVAWRRFATTSGDSDAIMVARSVNRGHSFAPPGLAHHFLPAPARALDALAEHRGTADVSEAEGDVASFDQGTSAHALSFRTNAYPTMTFDDQGRLYVAWTERGYAAVHPDAATGDARVVMVTSRNGSSFTAPRAVADEGEAGHQLMPTLAFGGGHLLLVYYDLREDLSRIFSQYVDDETAIAYSSPPKRHTIDIRASMGTPGDTPVFEPSTRVSDYLMGSRAGATGVEQLQFNPPNLPMFQLGTVPFIGDYIDVAQAPAFVVGPNGRWMYNSASAPVFHAVWTDNRDVRQPEDTNLDGNPWDDYTPPVLPGTSTFDPSVMRGACSASNTGSRNQNIYTARVTGGLLVGSPGNTKPLSATLQRAFVVFAQNQTNQAKSFRLTIQNQPAGGAASFDQFNKAVTSIDVTTPPLSLAARTVYVTSSDAHASINVSVAEIAAPGATGSLAGGLSGSVVLNPDISNPDISNPDISNPDISNPDISNAEVYNPDISNPDISNPDISNPDISNPDISNPDISNLTVANPDISNPDISNPDISNPDISNPDISNPDISNPDISNGAISDVTWTVTNTGNTTSSFDVNMFLAQQTSKVCPPGTAGSAAGCINVQLILYKTYKTPATTGCALAYETHNELVTNIPDPKFVDASSPGVTGPNDPAATNATLWLAPGESGKITLRLIDPDRSDNITLVNSAGQEVTIDPAFVPVGGGAGGLVTPLLQSQPVDTTDVATGVTTPPIVTPGGSTVFFVQQPQTGVVGAVLPTVRVQVRDASGIVIPGAQVTLALGNNPVGAVLSGGTIATADASGIATFANLVVDRAGTGFTLVASAVAAGYSPLPVTSSPFSVFDASMVYTVTTTADSGPGSLRQAMLDANSDPSTADTIIFKLSGVGPFTIAPLTPLPAIAGPVLVDGTSQPGYAGTPLVVVDGFQAGSGAVGFDMEAPASTVQGMSVVNFQSYAFLVRGTNDRVSANWIGTYPGAAAPAGNGFGVYLLYAQQDVVDQNVIVSSTGDGVLVVGGTGQRISQNTIGIGDTSAILPNGGNGITMYDGSVNTQVENNVISSNAGWGIELQQSGSLAPVTDTKILGNALAANTGGGIAIATVPTGQPAARNTIAANQIGPNGGLGIDLGEDGVTPNDAGDVDAGPNGLQNYPVLGPATTTDVGVTFNSTPNTTFALEFFSSAAADPSGYGQGEVPLGTATVTTDWSGDIAPFSYSFLSPVAAGRVITATATEISTGDTSEFSNAVTVAGSAPVITSVSPTPTAAGYGQMLTIRGTNLPATGPNDVLFSQGPTPVAATYTWTAGANQVIARLPTSLTPGPATVRLKNPTDTISTSYPITISATAAAPVLTLLETGGCATSSAPSGATPADATAGDSLSIEADGLDSSGATIWFTPSVGSPISVSAACTTGGVGGGVAAGFTIPSSVTPGTWTVQIQTTTSTGASPLSNGVTVTIH